MRYELGENGKPLPTKEQIISMVECARGGLVTKPAALVAVACLFKRPDDPRPDVSWARTVMDYPSGERIFDKMVKDEVLVGLVAHEWTRLGISTHLQNRTTHYATQGTYQHIHGQYTEAVAAEHAQRVRQAALEKLAELHPDQFAALVKETEENLPDSS